MNIHVRLIEDFELSKSARVPEATRLEYGSVEDCQEDDLFHSTVANWYDMRFLVYS